MKTEIEISVYKISGRILNTRESALRLFELIKTNSNKKVILNFSMVEFMSRSFADQFYKEKKQNQNCLTIVISNASDDIIRVINTVEKTQIKTDRGFIKLPVFYFTKYKMLSEYLYSI